MNWNCDDYNNAPAKLVEKIGLYRTALVAARHPARPTSTAQGPPEAFKMIMAREYGWGL
jgi:hypothetical protein